MKTAITSVCITLATIFSASALAADPHAGHGAMHGAVPAASDLADGLVKKIDKASGKVTIAHGPLNNLGMSAMTMVFGLKDPAWLAQLKEGDKIRFKAEQLNGSYIVVQFEKAQ